jgi:hypothetical protein
MVKILVALMAVLFFVFLIVVTPANGDQWNKKTILTFTGPVELPGIVLPPGKYVFKLLDSLANRHIVQVFNESEDHIYATILAIPDFRLTPKDRTVVRFDERPAGSPEALRAWFYPGDNFGQEFVYPKVRATELARETKLPVLAADVTPAEKPEELVKAPVTAVTPDNKEVEWTEAVQAAPPQPVSAQAPAPVPQPVQELPKAASVMPLVALIGLSFLLIAAALRVISKSSS